VSNLSQIGKALSIYEGDYHFHPGAGEAGIIRSNGIDWAAPSPFSWTFKVKPYLAGSSTVFQCPEYRPSQIQGAIRGDAFGYNAGGSAEIYHHMEKNLGLGFGESNFVTSTMVKVPSDMIAIGDVQFTGQVWCNVVGPQRKPVGTLIHVPSRHGGGANMLFLDSHLEWQKQGRWTAENDTSRARWNYDHEPHPETWR
jgi:prepilin-type processing-associated H-X9-DG protein